MFDSRISQLEEREPASQIIFKKYVPIILCIVCYGVPVERSVSVDHLWQEEDLDSFRSSPV